MIYLLIGFVCTFTVNANGDESVTDNVETAIVRSGAMPIIRYRAFIYQDYLVVEAKHEKEWHSYAIDNEKRALTALKGRASLGIEKGTTFELPESIQTDGPWLQPSPKDFSKPEIRWYTYGFDGVVYFARKIKKSDQPFSFKITGQACSGDLCRSINVELTPSRPEFDASQVKEMTDVMKTLKAVKSDDSKAP
ncbi:MAG: hypothetical protein AAF664_16285 [Planctomycetota bacterium]